MTSRIMVGTADNAALAYFDLATVTKFCYTLYRSAILLGVSENVPPIKWRDRFTCLCGPTDRLIVVR